MRVLVSVEPHIRRPAVFPALPSAPAVEGPAVDGPPGPLGPFPLIVVPDRLFEEVVVERSFLKSIISSLWLSRSFCVFVALSSVVCLLASSETSMASIVNSVEVCVQS